MRGVYEGGDQERERADKLRKSAEVVRGKWPRTARFLDAFADDYERYARREDARAHARGVED